MTRLAPLVLVVLFVGGCANEEMPERPNKKMQQRFDSMEARLDAAEAADPLVEVEVASEE